MIPFAPCYLRNRVRAELGPYIDILVKPVELDQPSPNSVTAHEVQARIRTEVKSIDEIEDMLTKQRMDGQCRQYYRIANGMLRHLRQNRRRIKRDVNQRQRNLRPTLGQPSVEPLKPTFVILSGLLSAALTVASKETRSSIATVTAMELAGLSQDGNNAYSQEVYQIGQALADHVRSQRPDAMWLDGAHKMLDAFTYG